MAAAKAPSPPPGGVSGRAVVLSLARRFWVPLAALAALEAAGAGLALLGPIPLQTAIDVVLEQKKTPDWLLRVPGAQGPTLLAALAGLSLLFAALNQAQGIASGLLSTHIGQRLILTLRARLFAAALRLSIKRHIDTGIADTMYRIQSDAQTVEWTLIDGALPVFTAVLTLVVMLSALFRLDPWLGVVGIAIAPPLLLSARLLRPSLKAGAKAARERESRALAVIQESLGALPAVKAFGREAIDEGRYRGAAESAVKARMRVAWLDGLLGAAVQLLCASGTAFALFVAIRAVQNQSLTIGQALLGLHYLGQIYSPLKTLGKKWASLQTQLAGLERAMLLLDTPPEVPERADPVRIGRAEGAIALEGIDFGYDSRRPVLQNATLRIEAGQRVGIVGETGAGKSTLLALLLRFYDPDAGRVTLDGIDLKDLKVEDVRRQVAVVFQETVLFSGTIAENIAVGKPDATPAQIEAAARAANLHVALARFPDGYDTAVGERGHALSGGERQRVGLARAFLRDAPILILDEPTSALDGATEASILDAMVQLMAGRTVLLVTHREQALVGCSRVVRVAGGQLTEVTREPETAAPVVGH